jgi:8-oxo-dGTP pyrophosphatase MutT (NUDIX family)
VAVVLAARASELDVLLMTRVERAGDRWSGQVSLPGGHRGADDADLLATALRETREETGVDLRAAGRLLGSLPRVQARARGRTLELWITPFVFLVTAAVPVRHGPEASEVFWLPLSRAARGAFDSGMPHPDDPLAAPLPCWRYDGRTIWGLTYGMLQSLALRLRLVPAEP